MRNSVKIIFKKNLFNEKEVIEKCFPIQKELYLKNKTLPIIEDEGYNFVIVPKNTSLYAEDSKIDIYTCLYLNANKNKQLTEFQTTETFKFLNLKDELNIIKLILTFNSTYGIYGFTEKTFERAIHELLHIYLLGKKTINESDIFTLLKIDRKNFKSLRTSFTEENENINKIGILSNLVKNICICTSWIGCSGVLLPNFKQDKNSGMCTMFCAFNKN